MADRDVMDINGGGAAGGEDNYDRRMETVVGAGRVGATIAAYEERRCVIVAQNGDKERRALSRRPEDRPVLKGEAVAGMQDLEGRTAQALAGVATQSAQAMQGLAQDTASAVGASHQAVSQLTAQTAQAFSATETTIR